LNDENNKKERMKEEDDENRGMFNTPSSRMEKEKENGDVKDDGTDYESKGNFLTQIVFLMIPMKC
jgi:hypothetical protein